MQPSRKSTLPVLFLLSCLLAMNLPTFLRADDPVQVGAQAPRISAKDHDGNPFDFGAAYETGTVLVYFYPKADTPGCTSQACSLRDGIEELKGLGITVVGVSKDTPEAQKRFREKYHLPFTLIADEDGKVAGAFGVGATLGFTKRCSFLVRDGKIVWIAPKAKTTGHAEEVREALRNL